MREARRYSIAFIDDVTMLCHTLSAAHFAFTPFIYQWFIRQMLIHIGARRLRQKFIDSVREIIDYLPSDAAALFFAAYASVENALPATIFLQKSYFTLMSSYSSWPSLCR